MNDGYMILRNFIMVFLTYKIVKVLLINKQLISTNENIVFILKIRKITAKY